jgi:hypothetical protein
LEEWRGLVNSELEDLGGMEDPEMMLELRLELKEFYETNNKQELNWLQNFKLLRQLTYGVLWLLVSEFANFLLVLASFVSCQKKVGLVCEKFLLSCNSISTNLGLCRCRL